MVLTAPLATDTRGRRSRRPAEAITAHRSLACFTEPKEHERKWRCYIRDPDGYIIEVSQFKM